MGFDLIIYLLALISISSVVSQHFYAYSPICYHFWRHLLMLPASPKGILCGCTHMHTQTQILAYTLWPISQKIWEIFFSDWWLLFGCYFLWFGASQVAQQWRIHLPVKEMWVRSLGGEEPLKKEMATHYSILAWRIPWTEEPGGLQSTGSHRVRHDWSNLSHLVHTHLQSENRKVISFQDFPNHAFFSIGESTHWSQKPAPTSDTSPWSQPEAVDVELTAYVLLTLLSKDDLTQKELGKATSIVAWLTKQQNAYGGFSSTQVNSLFLCHLSGRIGSHMEREEKRSPLPSRSGD